VAEANQQIGIAARVFSHVTLGGTAGFAGSQVPTGLAGERLLAVGPVLAEPCSTRAPSRHFRICARQLRCRGRNLSSTSLTAFQKSKTT